MSMTDPIADMLTRIRNANRALLERVDIPASRFKVEIAKTLKAEGFIRAFKLIDDNKQGDLRVYLKFGPGHERVILGLGRARRPGLGVNATEAEDAGRTCHASGGFRSRSRTR